MQNIDAHTRHASGLTCDNNTRSYLGGSIASSLHGMQQVAQDIDLIVDLSNQNLSSLFLLLK
jgi:hypothetical protein